LRRHGGADYELAALRARQIAPADFSGFDYVLAMDRANLDELARFAPPDARRTWVCSWSSRADWSRRSAGPYYGGTEDFERVLDLCEPERARSCGGSARA
jgi:protein-tyrosine phosphatase